MNNTADKTFPVTLDFDRWMRSHESAYVTVKSDLTGSTISVPKGLVQDMPQAAKSEIVAAYPGMNVSYEACKGIKVQMTKSTMQAILDGFESRNRAMEQYNRARSSRRW